MSVTISPIATTFYTRSWNAKFSIPTNLGEEIPVSRAFKFAGSSWCVRLSRRNCFACSALSFQAFPLPKTEPDAVVLSRWRVVFGDDDTTSWEWSEKNMPTSRIFLSKYVSNNTITIEFSLSLLNDNSILDKVPESTLSDDFKKVLFDEDSADTLLLLDDGSNIPVHTGILKARVPAIAGIISNTRKTTDNGAGKDDDSTRLTVPITEVQSGVLRELLHFGKLLFL